MPKKANKLWRGISIFIAVVSMLSGCETARGVSKGVGVGLVPGVVSGVEYTAKGMAKDASFGFGLFDGIDTWLRDNLW